MFVVTFSYVPGIFKFLDDSGRDSDTRLSFYIFKCWTSSFPGSYPARVVEKVQIMVEASYVGAEWRIPPMHGFLETAFIIPIIVYFFIFEAIALCIRSSTWTNHPSFEYDFNSIHSVLINWS
uniref:Bestrophin homolog n=2 Tax=Ascaris lumbricoides TaxID=6252 RepID=A0A0M3HJ52_ASCLU